MQASGIYKCILYTYGFIAWFFQSWTLISTLVSWRSASKVELERVIECWKSWSSCTTALWTVHEITTEFYLWSMQNNGRLLNGHIFSKFSQCLEKDVRFYCSLCVILNYVCGPLRQRNCRQTLHEVITVWERWWYHFFTPLKFFGHKECTPKFYACLHTKER